MNYDDMTKEQINYYVALLNRDKLLDYCNDWGAMGPIIQEYGICIVWPSDDFSGVGYASSNPVIRAYAISVSFTEKGQALRAAAICFLKMKES